jgi:hypothetical protein
MMASLRHVSNCHVTKSQYVMAALRHVSNFHHSLHLARNTSRHNSSTLAWSSRSHSMNRNRHITVIPLRLPRFPPVAPPCLPVAPRRVQTTSTSSLYKPCHTPDSWCRVEGAAFYSQTTTTPNTVPKDRNLLIDIAQHRESWRRQEIENLRFIRSRLKIAESLSKRDSPALLRILDSGRDPGPFEQCIARHW